MLTFSITINVPPFKKTQELLEMYGLSQFTKLEEKDQKHLLYYILSFIKEIIGGDYGQVAFEPTKRKDLHLHTSVKLESPIVEASWLQLKKLSNKFGNDHYNKCIDIQYCTDGGHGWSKYINKLNTPKAANLPLEFDDYVPEINVFYKGPQ